MKFNFVIIGGGVAGHRAAEEIRKGDATATIAIITDEPYRLYSRVMLPHVLHGKVPREKVFLIAEDWYEKNRIERIIGVVEKVDAVAKEVGIHDTRYTKEQSHPPIHDTRYTKYGYQKLLIASGGKPRTVEVPGTPFVTFRGLDDTDRIAEELKKLDALPKEARKVGIYGAGFIATEFIDLFAAHECEMHVFFRGAKFWGRQLDDASSKKLEDTLIVAGATLHPNTTFPDLLKWAPELRVVGVGIGVAPSFSFLEGTKVEFENGIRCNEFLETKEKDIWSAGDVAEYDDLITGKPQLVGTWLNAEMQGRRAGKNMLGTTRESYKLVTSYATKLLGVSITLIGEVHPMTAERVEVKEEGGGIVQKLYSRGKLIGATLVGTAQGRMELQKEIGG